MQEAGRLVAAQRAADVEERAGELGREADDGLGLRVVGVADLVLHAADADAVAALGERDAARDQHLLVADDALELLLELDDLAVCSKKKVGNKE